MASAPLLAEVTGYPAAADDGRSQSSGHDIVVHQQHLAQTASASIRQPVGGDVDLDLHLVGCLTGGDNRAVEGHRARQRREVIVGEDPVRAGNEGQQPGAAEPDVAIRN